MRIKIISLRGIQFEGEVQGLNVKTSAGEITVLNNHRPLISVLKKGKAWILKNDGNREGVEVNSGFLEMRADNSLSLLIS